MRAIGIPMYLLPGNHDPARRRHNIVVLDRRRRPRVRPGVEIFAAPRQSKAPTTDLVAEVLEGICRALLLCMGLERAMYSG